MIVLAVVLAFAGCMSLALGQRRKWEIVTAASQHARTGKVIRASACLLLAAALAVCVVSEGVGFAVLTWTLLVAVASFSVAMMLSFRPVLLKPLARLYSLMLDAE